MEVFPAAIFSSASLLVSVSLSAWTATSNFNLAARFMPSFNVASSTQEKSSMPLFDMNALKPMTPRVASSSSLSRFPGTSPPQKAKSVTELFCAAASFKSKLSASHVGGWALSGMLKNNVPPPAASAREPVAIPSQSAWPGSLKWTCESITPGKMWRPVASMTLVAASPLREIIFPSAIPISEKGSASWMSRSNSGMAFGKSLDEVRKYADSSGDIGGFYGLGGVVTDAVFAADEQHRNGTNRRKRRGVVSRTAHQLEDFRAAAAGAS